MIVGVPKEIMPGERRVAVTPDTCRKLCGKGMKVLVQAGAGEGAFLRDEDYASAGGTVVADAEEVYRQAELILKVKEPQFCKTTHRHEVSMMRPGQFLVTFLHPASPSNHEMIRQLAAQGVTALTLDSVPRISRAQTMDALTSMSTVAGYKAALMAADRLSCFMPMVATAVGMLPPSKVLVVGAGVAGLQALATAKRLGAVIFAADVRPAAREQATSLGAKIHDLGVPDDIAVGEGGYARSLPADWLVKEREALKPAVKDADIIILSALVPGRRAPVLVTADMVRSMKPGSAIVDIAIDQGGNCETTSPGEVVVRNQVSIDGTKNIPGMVPVASTRMFAENVCNFVSLLVDGTTLRLTLDDEILAACLVTHQGRIVHAGALEAMQQSSAR
ncbi:MAG: NAD(P) transhydrogenase subunit alpha [Planctomycetes bacterium]|nr:NAD(P) transhydrogenase subunit alpha [Planctomycetota bacterium]